MLTILLAVQLALIPISMIGGILLTDDYRKIAWMITFLKLHTFTILEGGYYISDLGKNVASYLKGVQEACL